MADLTLVVTPQVAQVVTLQPNVAQIVKLPGQQGPAGPIGPQGPAGAQLLSLVAGTALSGHRIVTTDNNGAAIYADSSTLTHAQRVVGITTGAAASGASVSVQNGGELSDPSFAYTPGTVLYLGTTGLILTAAPTSGFALRVGFAETATKIYIAIGSPVILV